MKYIMVLPSRSFDIYMYSDILECKNKNVVLYNPDEITENKIQDFIKLIHTRLCIISMVDLPLKAIYL